MLIIGLAGFVRSGAATGWLARIGLTAAFAHLGVYTLASILAFTDRAQVQLPLILVLTRAVRRHRNGRTAS